MPSRTLDWLREIFGASEQLLELIDKVLQFSALSGRSRLSAGRGGGSGQGRALAPMLLCPLADDLVKAFGPRAEAAGLDLLVCVDPSLFIEEGRLKGPDSENLRRCLHYLAENVRATTPG